MTEALFKVPAHGNFVPPHHPPSYLMQSILIASRYREFHTDFADLHTGNEVDESLPTFKLTDVVCPAIAELFLLEPVASVLVMFCRIADTF